VLSTAAPEFTKWQRDVEVAIEQISGKEGRHLKDFQAIKKTFRRLSIPRESLALGTTVNGLRRIANSLVDMRRD
jgi:hypothetical protein